jgi:hypothetical protein
LSAFELVSRVAQFTAPWRLANDSAGKPSREAPPEQEPNGEKLTS